MNTDRIPLLDLSAQYETISDELHAAVDKVLQNQQFIMGEPVRQLENELRTYIGARHAVGCASGSDALLLALMSAEIGRGDLVITSPFTFFATAGAIARVGAIPVFVDIDPLDYNLDVNQVEDFLKGRHPLSARFSGQMKNVRAILPVHLYGQCADMDPLRDLARRYNLYLIEDAAQSIGSYYKKQQAGTFGEFGCFSFFPSKNLGAAGDAGLLTVNDGKLAEKASTLRLHGAKPKYYHHMVGVNSRLDTLQAAILRVKLKYLEHWSQSRREKAMRYRELFEEADCTIDTASGRKQLPPDAHDTGAGLVERQPGRILLPVETTGDPASGGRHIYHQFVIRSDRRDRIQEALGKAGIGSAVYYPVPLHEQACFNHLGYTRHDCPVAHRASRQTLALPIYPELTEQQQQRVVDTVTGILRGETAGTESP